MRLRTTHFISRFYSVLCHYAYTIMLIICAKEYMHFWNNKRYTFYGSIFKGNQCIYFIFIFMKLCQTHIVYLWNCVFEAWLTQCSSVMLCFTVSMFLHVARIHQIKIMLQMMHNCAFTALNELFTHVTY